MSDTEARLDAIEERLNDFDSWRQDGGSYAERGGNRYSLQDTFRLVDVLSDVVSFLASEAIKGKLNDSDRDELETRLSRFEAVRMSIFNHPHAPRG